MRTLIVALAMAALVGCAQDKKQDKQEAKKIDASAVPKQVMDSVNARLPGAQVTSAEKENEGGGILYDLELRQQGRKYEMDIKEDGTVMEIEKEMAAKDVPPAVMRTVEVKYPGAKVKEVMEVNKVSGKQETPDHYEVVITSAGGNEKEVVVSLDGSSAKEEAPEANEKK